MLITVYNCATSESIGEINEEQFELLKEQLAESSAGEERYYIDSSTVEYLEEFGADEDLIVLLRQALEGEDGIEIYIEEEESTMPH